jgi:hypothetical protein
MKIKIAGTFLVILALTILGLNVVVPRLIRKKLDTYVSENCGTCVLNIGAIRTDVLLSNVTFQNIHFYWGDPRATAFDFRIPLLRMHVVLSDLFKHLIHLQHVVIEEPNAEVLEGDLRSLSYKSNGTELQFAVDGVEIVQAHFTYTREHNGRLAPIHVDQIHGQVDQVGNTPDLRDHITTAQVTAVLENSGKINLKVMSHIFAKALNAEIDLAINRLPLNRMNPYFETNDGVKLSGQLAEDHCGAVIRQKQLHAFVQAQYEGLDVQFNKNQGRTAFSAFLLNLVEKLKLNAKNMDTEQSLQIQYANIQREQNETILKFIIRGIKEASLKVASKK